ncbi:hypothetical protein Hanom_Chr01g00047821 [Helianthus anomalus]
MCEGLRRVGGAILTELDQTLDDEEEEEERLGVLEWESSSVDVDEGGGRSPYNPPSIVLLLCLMIDQTN